MPTTIIEWTWEEAFDKFGFGDGDSWNGTEEVAYAIKNLGYDVECDTWGCHNYMICDITKNGRSILLNSGHMDDWRPEVAQRMAMRGGSVRGRVKTDLHPESMGYEDPRKYLPDDIIEHLDEEFSDEEETAA